ncbi:DUF2867 domain-containing protein [Epibacterium sp. MM17-32]|uniref:DUF2867 domain-containing protein n=1 Tax=Epibacterium sp. MM17-32 TaxID=2917734 RepID=UPI001EF6E446|nr:DUF2867 domain-containing protein [Epibacterium sp. MM17-32]MCG7630179.1 DUF2867 domain-containing protein [Epibacterium sp. MM17-32]
MPKIETSPLPKTSTLWRLVQPGDFIDGYAVESHLGPRVAADIGLSMPKWASALLALRNRIVRPLGLKTEVSDTGEGAIFPVTHHDAQEVILGTDDTHLNFRICVRQEAGRIHMATWVHRNNWLGRIYLMVVMPFHILIVRDSMRRIARADTPAASAQTPH